MRTLAAVCAALASLDAAAGEAIYLEGRTSAGAAVEARRAGGSKLQGAEAACVNCHRRSGFGGYEGRSYIPPVTSQALFQPVVSGTGVAAGKGRAAYTEQTLARALRTGVDPAGRRFEYLMPRYELSSGDMKRLTGYLRTLSATPSAGVDADTVHFATIVAPGMESQSTQSLVNALDTCFASQNAGRVRPKGRQRYSASMRFDVRRKWQLHVWTLQGEPQTWEAQLARHEAAHPVFAAVGGLGRAEWDPVQRFCEARRLPCLFPHLEAPPSSAPGFYSLYLSQGVLLEAALVADDLAATSATVKRAVQVLRPDDDTATRAARALADQLGKRGVSIDTVTPESFIAGKGQPAVLWLRPRDLQRLPAASPLYLSATLGGNVARPPSARIASPYAGFPADAVRANTTLACSALRAGMQDIGEHLQRDFLIERIEAKMERLQSAEPYARVSLGIGQRYAAKSGFLLH